VLQISQRISSHREDVSFNIQPKSKNKINDQWGSKCEKRDINKPGSDSGRCYSHLVANSRANSKELPLYEIFQFIHTAKLENSPNFHQFRLREATNFSINSQLLNYLTLPFLPDSEPGRHIANDSHPLKFKIALYGFRPGHD